MADKELRAMNRTELIEIIYALQQNERTLRSENEQLRLQLEDKLLRIGKAGSIAEAALSLNQVFESAEKAAQQYVASVKSTAAEQLKAEAQQEASMILASAKAEADKAAERSRQTEIECRAMQEETVQKINKLSADFVEEVRRVLKKYPELATHMWEDTGQA